MSKYDIIIIGAGPGGYVAAIRAAQLGANVALVEKETVGGTCLNRGCIPTKALLESAHFLAKIKNASQFGINTAQVSLDYKKAAQRKNRIVARLTKGVEFLLKANKVELIRGTANVKSPTMVEVGSKVLEAKKALILALGSRPASIPGVGIDEKFILSSDAILNLENAPKSILIVGGGVMGVEFANIFHNAGSEVTLIEMMDNLLPCEDRETTKILETSLQKRGIKIHLKTKVGKIDLSRSPREESRGSREAKEEKVCATLSSGEEITAEKMFITTGRLPNSEGLEKIGLKLKERNVLVNEKMETNVPGVYAIGDLVGGAMLAHVASTQGKAAAENIMGQNAKMDYSAIPCCTFTSPPLASVGIKEREAQEKNLKVKISKFPFTALGMAQAMGETEGFVKIIADAKTEQILGAHIVGPGATKLIAELTLAVKMKMKVKDIAKTIHAHPTLPEAVMEAAEGIFGQAIHIE